MNDPETIRLVCFDLGGVILRICRSWDEACRAAGLEVRTGGESFVSGSGEHADLHSAHQCGEIDLATYAGSLSRLMGGLYAPEEIVLIHDVWIKGEYPGVGDVVTRLDAAGVETAVLSNTSHEHWVLMAGYPTLRRLRNRFGSHQLGVRKPAVTAYRAIERHTGFQGGEVLFFDDLDENVATARSIGWQASQIDPLGSPAEQINQVLNRYHVA